MTYETQKKESEDVNIIKTSSDLNSEIIEELSTNQNSSIQEKIKTKQDLQTLNFSELDTFEKMLEVGKVLINSKLVPFKKAEDVVCAIIAGKELGIPLFTALTKIYVISDRPSLSVHIIRGILLSKGIWFNKTRDFEPFFEFVEAENGKVKLEDVTENGKITQKPIVIKHGFLDEKPDVEFLKRKIDNITIWEFEREIITPLKKTKEIKIIGKFSYLDAINANLIVKDNWKFYPRFMCSARAFDAGAFEIADDYLNGINSLEVLADVNGVDIEIQNDNF